MKTGDIADGGKISGWLFERVKKAYGNLGYIQYTGRGPADIHHKEERRRCCRLCRDDREGDALLSPQFDSMEMKCIPDALLREMLVAERDLQPGLARDSLTRF